MTPEHAEQVQRYERRLTAQQIVKDDKITVIDDLHISTQEIYFTRWDEWRTARRHLQCFFFRGGGGISPPP